MTTPNLRTGIVFQALDRTYPRIDSTGDHRFEVRPGASFYIRRRELARGEDFARINTIYIRNFPNLDALRAYIEHHGIRTDHTGRDHLIEPEHIDAVIDIIGED